MFSQNLKIPSHVKPMNKLQIKSKAFENKLSEVNDHFMNVDRKEACEHIQSLSSFVTTY